MAKQQDIDAAKAQLTRLERFRAGDPHNPHLLADVADLHIKLGAYQTARELLQGGLVSAPDHPALIFCSATLAIATADYSQAIESLERLLAAGNDAPVVRYNLAYALLMSARPADAKAQLELIDATAPSVPARDLLLARACHHVGDIENAIAAAKRHLERNPEDIEAQGLLALFYLDGGDDVAAKEWAEKTLVHDSSNRDALIALGSAALNVQDIDQASGIFERTVQSHPQSGRGWMGKGLVSMASQNLREAREELKKATTYMPNYIGLWNSLGWCELLLNDLAAARQSFEKALALDRTFGEVHGELAVVAFLEGKTEEAEVSLKRALRLNPGSFAARFAQSLMLAKAGKAQEAGAVLQKVFAAEILEGKGTLQELVRRLQKNIQSSKP